MPYLVIPGTVLSAPQNLSYVKKRAFFRENQGFKARLNPAAGVSGGGFPRLPGFSRVCAVGCRWPWRCLRLRWYQVVVAQARGLGALGVTAWASISCRRSWT